MTAAADPAATDNVPGTQTLIRGLSVLDAVGRGDRNLPAIANRLDCTRSTTQRLASALVRAGWLQHGPQGYALGARLVELGFLAREDMPLPALARPHLEALGAATRDTVHLGIREGGEVLYLDKIGGRRGLEMRSRIGHRMKLALTGVGRALMLDMDETDWRAFYVDATARRPEGEAAPVPEWAVWRERMRGFAASGVVFDREENEMGVCCVAAPIRDASGAIVAALSVASASPYMPETRMHELAPAVSAAAGAVSAGLGWRA